MYLVTFGKLAVKDKKLLKQAGLERKAKDLLNILMSDPFQSPPPYEKLIGKSFPLFNYDEWNSIDEWLGTLHEGVEKAKNGEDMDKWTSELSENMKKRVEELFDVLGR